jgi:flagellar protein FlbT
LPLKLDLKTGIKMIINGAVIENIGPNTKLLVHNDSAILREKEVLSDADTNTPAARVYYALQCAYMFPFEQEKYLKKFKNFLNDYISALPSAAEIGQEILKDADSGQLYKALKKTQNLIHHEARIAETMKHGLEDLADEYLPEEDDDIGNR